MDIYQPGQSKIRIPWHFDLGRQGRADYTIIIPITYASSIQPFQIELVAHPNPDQVFSSDPKTFNNSDTEPKVRQFISANPSRYICVPYQAYTMVSFENRSLLHQAVQAQNNSEQKQHVLMLQIKLFALAGG